MMNKMKNLWCFISISPCCLTYFKFSGASKLHDPTKNMKLVQIKDKEKLNRTIENQPYHACDIIVFIGNYLEQWPSG